MAVKFKEKTVITNHSTQAFYQMEMLYEQVTQKFDNLPLYITQEYLPFYLCQNLGLKRTANASLLWLKNLTQLKTKDLSLSFKLLQKTHISVPSWTKGLNFESQIESKDSILSPKLNQRTQFWVPSWIKELKFESQIEIHKLNKVVLRRNLVYRL